MELLHQKEQIEADFIFIVSPCISHIFINLYQLMHYILTKIL